MPDELRDDHIAVIGMACRFPGATTLEEYWANLAGGVESLTRLTEEQMAAAGVAPREFRHPHYVNAAFLMRDMDRFDARFFGYTPREAEVRDPQGRWFLEACYAAVQDSGYDPARIDGLVGVVGGMANDLYAEHYVKRNAALSAAVGPMAIGVGGNPDYLATTVSYRLGFQGPSINVQTACSTALLAVHTASQLLRSGECDYALAGGVEVELPEHAGHTWVEGNIYTKDGHIRPFDADATGTLFGSGVGVVALKRLDDALADGDHVYAVLRGSAVNNDGGDRAGFTAPGIEGQVQLIVEALAAAKVHPDTIGFVEAHATGTLVGDPIEVAGLRQAYRAAGGTARRSIPIGSVKANIGHLGPASGVAGLIKVCLALEHGQIPPTINYATPNPNLDLDESPFYVATELTPWPAGDAPRRAGVSSFGIGGTNVHVIVEEAPAAAPTAAPGPDGRRWHTIPVSGKSAAAAEASARLLGAALAAKPDYALEDVAFTAQVGRPAFAHRRAIAADSLETAAQALEALAESTRAKPGAVQARELALLFPGQGAQHVGMGRGLYESEPVYRDAVDECARLLAPHIGTDIRELLYPAEGATEQAEARLRETRHSQPALFTAEYALAKLLASAGLVPSAMIGHSVGEYVAATLSGVFALPDALAIVAARGRLMQQMNPGAMLAVDAPAFAVVSLLPDDVEVAAVNGPRATVVAGSVEAVERVREDLTAQQIACTALATSHAFHSSLMEPCLEDFAAVVAAYPRSAPTVPFVSNVTGTWLTDEEAADPGYWARHLRSSVLFADGLASLLARGGPALAEVGPGDTLTRFAQQAGAKAVPAMRRRLASAPDERVLAEAIGALWCQGAEVDWAAWTGPHNRVPLPAYPFERTRFWAEPDPVAVVDAAADEEADWPLPAERCSFTQVWREEALDEPAGPVEGSHHLVFDGGHAVSEAYISLLTERGATVTVVRPGPGYAQIGPRSFTIRPDDAEDLRELFDATAAEPPTDIVHAFCLGEPAEDAIGARALEIGVAEGFYSLLHLGRELARRVGGAATRVHVITSNMQEISGSERLEPAKALVLGPVMLAQREIAGVTCRSIDLAVPAPLPAAATAAQLLAEITSSATVAQVGWRGRKRWRLDYRMVPLDPPRPDPEPGGTYVVTGGLGALGLVVAEDLAESAPSTIVLLSRSAVPPRDEWQELVASQDTDTALRGKLVRLLAIEERGSTVVAMQCDVAQPEACAATVRQVRESHGRIRGVYHSAGVAGGAMMAVRTDADAAAVLAPKVEGTLALYRLLAEEADFLVLFSSLTAATGTFGQVDYCAANNFQDAFARWAAQQGSPVISVGWMQWTESGMYADREGAAPQAFRELQTGARYEPAEHPLLDRRVLGDGDVVAFSTLLEPGTHWISAEHRLGGQDVVVGTGLLEMVDGAYREAFGAVPEIRDALFLGPIGVTGPTEIRIELTPDGGGHAVTVTAAAVAGAQPGEWTERLRCRLVPREAGPVPTHDLAAIAERCSRLSLTGEQCRSAGGMIEHGAHWTGNIKSMAVGTREELSRVELDERYWAECGRYRLHPALLDTAVAEANYAEDRLERGENYLPFGYGRLRAHEPLPPRFWVHITHLAEPGAEIDRMTIVLMHGDGQEIARIDEYAERRVDPAAIRAIVTGSSAEASARRRVAAQAQSIDEASITPELGRDVLRRILHWRPAPHLLVVPEGIHRNLRRTQSLTIDVVQRELGTAILAAGHERLVETEYAPPQTQAEVTIAGLWESALGVAQIGLDDEFFELGGNSLVAVQLAARMREALDVELPIAVLFDHPTVRAMAAFVAKTRAEQVPA